MNRLKEINDEIYRRWKAGENYVDLAKEYQRNYLPGLETMLSNRWYAEQHANEPPGRGGPTKQELKEIYGPRNIEVVRRREAGETYAAIAKDHNICRERVRQIWFKHLRKIHDPRAWQRRPKKPGNG